jgi:IS5 family transposase
MERRGAIEPTIGHLKAEHRLERNHLKGTQGNAINALLSTAAMNFQKLLGFFLCRLLHFLRSLSVPAPRDQFWAVMS